MFGPKSHCHPILALVYLTLTISHPDEPETWQRSLVLVLVVYINNPQMTSLGDLPC